MGPRPVTRKHGPGAHATFGWDQRPHHAPLLSLFPLSARFPGAESAFEVLVEKPNDQPAQVTLFWL